MKENFSLTQYSSRSEGGNRVGRHICINLCGRDGKVKWGMMEVKTLSGHKVASKVLPKGQSAMFAQWRE